MKPYYVLLVSRVVKTSTGDKHSPRTNNVETLTVSGLFRLRDAQKAQNSVLATHTAQFARIMDEKMVREDHAKGSRNRDNYQNAMNEAVRLFDNKPVTRKPTSILYSIGKTDGTKLSAAQSGLDRSVRYREFDTLEAAHQFQEKHLKAVDPVGLSRGDYYLDDCVEEVEDDLKTVKVTIEGGKITNVDVPDGVKVIVYDADASANPLTDTAQTVYTKS